MRELRRDVRVRRSRRRRGGAARLLVGAMREARARVCEAVTLSAQLLLARYGRCVVERSFRTRFIAVACPDQLIHVSGRETLFPS